MPYVTLVRMAVNLGIGVLVGSIPLLGDIFDIVWKANRRNYRLLHAPPAASRAATPGAIGCFCVAGLRALAWSLPLPLALVVWLVLWLASPLSAALCMPRRRRALRSPFRDTIEERVSGRSAVW